MGLVSWLGGRRRKIVPVEGKWVEVSYPGLRAGSRIKEQEINLVYNFGGMGDYVHWTTVFQYIFSEHSHLFGNVLVPRYFGELARYWLSEFGDRVNVIEFDRLEDCRFYSRGDRIFLGPNQFQGMNTCGFHLLAFGFHCYLNRDTIPEGWNKLPVITGGEADISRFMLPDKHVVVTTEATSPIRRLKSSTINELVGFIKGKGLEPVFLGKRSLAHDYSADCDEGVSTKGVLDLRDKTSALEAASILSGARAVVGLDNGLLHLASCSRVPVVFGFNTVDPRHRVPPRVDGAKTVVVTPPKELTCRFCQSNIRAVLHLNFHKCLYGDEKCLDFLDAKNFIRGLSLVLD